MRKFLLVLALFLIPLSSAHAFEDFDDYEEPVAYGIDTIGLISYFQFNEGSGITAHDSVNPGRVGTFVNSPTYSTGTYGTGVRFGNGGTNQHVTLNSTIIGDQATYTWNGWVASTATNDSSLYAECNSGSNNQLHYFHMNENVTGDIEWGYRDDTGGGGSFITTGNIGINDGKSHMITAVQYSKSSRDLFIDGVFRGHDGTTVGTLTLNTAEIGAQQRVALSAFMGSGVVDQFSAWNVAKSTVDVVAIYNSKK